MKRIVLENGLRILSLKTPRDSTARAVIGVDYGPIYDTKKNKRISTFSRAYDVSRY